MSDKRIEELKARLDRAARGPDGAREVSWNEGGSRVTVRTGGGFGWGIWLMRGAALLFAAVFTLLAPVVGVDCEATGAGTVGCTFTTSTAGVRPIASERVTGIVRAETTPNGYGVRLFGPREQVLYERGDSALVGLSMRRLAQGVQALADGSRQAPVHGWQWPLPIAALCGIALLFAASGLVPALRWAWRAVFGQPSPEAAARASANGTSWAVAFIATAAGFGVSYVAPVVSYRCEAAGDTAHCVVERRYLGLVALERIDVPGIARADSSAYTRTRQERDASSNQQRTSSESISTVSFQSRDGRLLYEDEQSGAIGTSARDIADAVGALADGTATAPVRLSQMPWVPALLASLGLLIGTPTLLALAVGPLFGARARGVFGAVVLGGTVLALAAGWTLALLGHA